MAVINNYYYLLTRAEATDIYGEAASINFRFSTNDETFVSKNATDKRAMKLGKSAILEDKYWYSNVERLLILEGAEWQTNEDA